MESADVPPILLVPDDILLEIFYLIVEDAHISCWGPAVSGLPLPYSERVNLMLVCCRWRDIVIHTPRLWSLVTVSCFDPVWAIQMLARSVNADLYLQAVVGGKNRDQRDVSMAPFIRTMLLALPRVRDLHMLCYDEHVFGTKPSVFDVGVSCAPSLEKLHFEDNYNIPEDNDRSRGYLLDFMEKLSMPSLKSLHLHRPSQRTCQAFTHSSLTSLTIIIPEAVRRLEVSYLTSLLSGLPMLERLVLSLWPRQKEYPVSPGCDAVFPHLKYLEMESQVSVCAEILSRATFPPSAAISLSFSDLPGPPASDPAIIPQSALVDSIMKKLFFLNLDCLHGPPVHLCVNQEGEREGGGHSITLFQPTPHREYSRSTAANCMGSTRNSIYFSLRIRSSLGHTRSSPLPLGTLLDYLPLQNVRSAEFHLGVGTKQAVASIKWHWTTVPQFWAMILCKLNSITSLHYSGVRATGFLKSLLLSLPTDSTGGGAHELVSASDFFSSTINPAISPPPSIKSTSDARPSSQTPTSIPILPNLQHLSLKDILTDQTYERQEPFLDILCRVLEWRNLNKDSSEIKRLWWDDKSFGGPSELASVVRAQQTRAHQRLLAAVGHPAEVDVKFRIMTEEEWRLWVKA